MAYEREHAMSSPMKMVKARPEEVGGAGTLEFKFNPTEYTVRKSAKWNIPALNMKGKAGAKPEFLGTDPQTISMQILFDDWESAVADVSKQVERLFNSCTPSKRALRS